jgi:rhodanese-related sulfurtransferase
MKTITVEELKAKKEQGAPFHLLDVREPSEYAEGNLGGLLFPLGKIVEFQIDDIADWKDEEVVVYCKGGTRSMRACMILEQAGFTNVVNLTGGIMEWQRNFGI